MTGRTEASATQTAIVLLYVNGLLLPGDAIKAPFAHMGTTTTRIYQGLTIFVEVEVGCWRA